MSSKATSIPLMTRIELKVCSYAVFPVKNLTSVIRSDRSTSVFRGIPCDSKSRAVDSANSEVSSSVLDFSIEVSSSSVDDARVGAKLVDSFDFQSLRRSSHLFFLSFQ